MKKTILLSAFIGLASLLQAQTGLTFGDSTTYVSIPSNSVYDLGTAPFTFEATVNMDSLTAKPGTIFSSRTSTEDGLLVMTRSGGTRFLLQMQSVEGGNIEFEAGQNYFDSQCHTIALVREADSTISFYFDGELKHNITYRTKNIVRQRTSNVSIGADLGSSRIGGAISEVRLWNVARTAGEIAENYNVGLQGSESGLVGYWKLNEGSGQVVKDYSTVGNDGFLGNSVSTTANDPTWRTNLCVRETPSVDLPISPTGVKFTGRNHLSIASSSKFNFDTSAFLIETIISIPVNSNTFVPIFSSRTSTEEGVLIMANDETSLLVQLQGVSGLGNLFFNTPINYYDGLCHHIAVQRSIYDTLSIYFDGEVIAKQKIRSRRITRSGDSTPIYIGKDISASGLEATISEFRIWANTFPDDAVKKYFDKGLKGNEEGLVAYWKCDEDSGQVAYDKTANGLNAVFGSTVNAESNDPEWVATCDMITTAETTISNQELVLFPNPTENQVSITGVQVKRVKVLNLLGIEMNVSVNMSNEITSIDCSELENGMYIIQIETNGKSESKTFMKK